MGTIAATTSISSSNEFFLSENLKSVNERLNRVETDFSNNFRKLDSRMEEFLVLGREIALLREQSRTQGNSIEDIRAAMNDHSDKIEQSLTRMQNRVMEITESTRKNISSELSKISLRVSETADKHSKLESKFYTWFNRGLGGWFAILFIAGILQFIGVRWIEDIDIERKNTEDQLKNLVIRVERLESPKH